MARIIDIKLKLLNISINQLFMCVYTYKIKLLKKNTEMYITVNQCGKMQNHNINMYVCMCICIST